MAETTTGCELVKFKSDTGDEVQITAKDVRNTICPNATDKEVTMFLELCKAQRLNPWVRDAYLVKYGNSPASIITSKDAYLKRANASKGYQGMEAGVVYLDRSKNVCKREGGAVYKAAGEQLLGGWCRVYVEGKKPFYEEVPLEEYTTGKAMWQKSPSTMIRKVAMSHATREAFPENLQGLYVAEEMGEAGEAVMVGSQVVASMATEEQSARIGELVHGFASLRGKSDADVVSALMATGTMRDAGASNIGSLTSEQADAAINLLEIWFGKASEVVSEKPQEPHEAQEAPEPADVPCVPQEAAEGPVEADWEPFDPDAYEQGYQEQLDAVRGEAA